ncbi:MAG: efflux RND transporter permease subunit [Agathobaculum sp.]|jgi:CzcA family heavy metal efflux pump|uniref:efflux RND transporter permease subunit n=1 Tax=Agathobaculum sp. TaxID=2048138 RepID=UPI003D8FC61D
MNIAEKCIKHHVMTILAYILVAIFGVYCFQGLPLALMPDMELPVAMVYATYVGASPEDIEQQVTKPLEAACASLSGLDTLSSTSSENISMVVVQFEDGTDLDKVMVDMRDKVDMAKAALPEDASDPTVMSIDVDAMPVALFALRGGDLAAMQSVAEDELKPALERLDGVASVDISGGYEDEIAVKTDPARLKGYNLTVSTVAQQIGADNMAVPGGDLDRGSQSLSVRTDGEYKTVDDVKNALIALPAGGTVRLSQIADVAMQPKDRTVISKVDGEECVILSVNKQSGSNTVKIAELAKQTMEKKTAENERLQCSVLMDQSDFINMTVDNAVSNILYGVLFAAIVLFFFLRDMGATIAISVAMPVCILFTFLIMYVLDITLNMLSLGGITLGVGMIVDNSVVVLDNIFRYRSDGYDVRTACVEGTKEVAMSVIASTLTTICVFLPIGLSGGMTGMMFREMSITIVVLLASSLIIALTLVPLLSFALLRRGGKHRQVPIPEVKDKVIIEKPVMRWYKNTLKWLISRRSVGMLITLAICVVSVVSIGAAGTELIPEMDQGQIGVTVDMPTGASMEETAAIQERIARIALDTIPEIDQLYYSTGDSASVMSASSGASVTIMLTDLKDRSRSATEIANELRRHLADIAGCELTVSSSSMMEMTGGSDISIQLMGRDYDELAEAADALAREVAALPDAINVESSSGKEVPRVAVKINRENASRFGLSAAAIGGLVRAELTGSTATTLRMGGEEYDVTVSGSEASSESLDALRSMQLPTAAGGTVPLSMVADVYTELSPQSISRVGQQEVVTITGQSESGDAAGMNASVQALLANYELPEGVEIDDGETTLATINETMNTLLLALAVSILLIYFVLASQYNSFLLPVIIMTIMPVGLLASMALLAPTGHRLSMVALLGVIILAGTVVNSSIVLIDYIEQRRAHGEDKQTAILNACPRRVRPVLMTSLTTILGLVPMVFSGGEGAEMMRPMGIVMMTGMVVSTAATLFITPVYYSLMDSLTERFKNRKKMPKQPRGWRKKKNPTE